MFKEESMTNRFIFVEDTYGIVFHRELINKLMNKHYLDTTYKPIIRRMHAKKCNPALSRKTRALIYSFKHWRALFIIDSEGRNLNEAVEDVASHFSRYELKNIRVIVVRPRHESWLCIGLGGSRNQCRSRPEEVIVRMLINRGLRIKYYEKSMLTRFAKQINIDLLLSENDFREYIEGLRWLLV